MSWQAAFEIQWSTFLTVVEARLRREIATHGHVGAARADAIVAEAVAVWTRGARDRTTWLSTLDRSAPELGARFRRALEAARLHRPIVPARALPIVPVTLVLAAIASITGLLAWQHAGPVQFGLGVLLALMTNGPAARALWADRCERATTDALHEARTVLAVTGARLREIAAEADAQLAVGPYAPESELPGLPSAHPASRSGPVVLERVGCSRPGS